MAIRRPIGESPARAIPYARVVRVPAIPIMCLVVSWSLNGVAQTSEPAVSRPEGSPGAAAQIHSQYFSGFVAEMAPGSLTVTRKSAPGHDTLRRVFVMDRQTKVEGKLKLNARVTVRFEATPAGERAVRILVRG